MKRWMLLLLAFFYLSTPTALHAVSQWEIFSLTFAIGNAPLVGQAMGIYFLRLFSKSKHPGLQALVKPGTVGLVTGTLFYIGFAEYLKSLPFDLEKDEAYLYAITPGLLILIALWLKEKCHVTPVEKNATHLV